MKLVKRASLAYQGGTSDKVYEADLCEVGRDLFVVNFRYGRRGSALREGTKTTEPVPREQAEKIFDRLVASKKAEGYWDAASPPPAASAPPPPASPVPAASPLALSPRERAIVDVIAGTRRASEGRKNRAIWRAGELGTRAAEPYLHPLASEKSELRQYIVAAALGRCGSAHALATLEALLAKTKSDMVRRMALEAQRALVFARGDVARREWLEKREGELPPALAKASRQDARAFGEALGTFLEVADERIPAALETVYRIDSPVVRPALLEAARTAPLAKHFWKAFRHLYKMAEYRRDAKLFGILAWRIERARPTAGARRIPQTGEIMPVAEREGVSRATRAYLRKRTWRTLRRLALDGKGELYVAMSAGVLAPFSDADAEAPRKRETFRWDRATMRLEPVARLDWDAFARYWAFNHVLHGKSARFVAAGRGFFRCRGWKPGDPEPEGREDAFPELWDASPRAVLALLEASACERVHRFGVNVLRGASGFLTSLDSNALASLLLARYDVTAALGLEVCSRNFPLDAPDEVLAALACSRLEAARQEAWRRFDALAERILASTSLVARLVRAPHADTRERVRRLLAARPLGEDLARVVVGRLVADLRADPPEELALALDVVKTLVERFARELGSLGEDVVRDLLSRPHRALVLLGAEILFARQAAGVAPADGAAIARLIGSDAPELRSVGVRMLGHLDAGVLLGHQDLLVALATNDLADLREAVRPVVRRIAERNADFAGLLAGALVRALLVKKRPEAMHAHLLRMLEEDLASVLPRLTKEHALILLRSPHTAAQELGGALLRRNVRPDELSVKEIVRLASHDVRAVREAARWHFEESRERVRAELARAIAILDSPWEDTRAFAMSFFQERIPESELGPSLLVAICDSARPQVQQFGRDLIAKRFQEAQGEEYLLKLSEHPSTELQLFASNFLERFAKGDAGKLAALSPYFVSVLSRVNKGRVAKDRALAFLLAEGLRSEEAARTVAAIFARQSVTIAVGDKATLIEGMLAIRRAFPSVELPISVEPVETRARASAGGARGV